jgi:uncharacterized membrane protein YfcA
MDLLHLAVLFAAGCVAGFLAGFFGVGGGIILVPILVFYLQAIGTSSLVATHIAFGTSLIVVVFASMASAFQYSRNQHVVWKAVAVMGIASIAGAWAGATIAAGLQGKELQRIFAAVVTVAAVRLLAESRKSPAEHAMNLSVPGLGVIGVVVGLVSSLAGVGGGVFSIPMMYYFMKFPLKKALGTSSATIIITAVAAAAGYIVHGRTEVLRFAPELSGYTLGYVDYFHALPIIVGTLPLASLGARVAHSTNVDRLRKYYGVFLLIIATRMFFF